MIKEKNKMMSKDEQQHVYLCGKVWRKYVRGEEVLVVTEHSVCPSVLFGPYFEVIKKGIDKGLVKLLTLAQVEAEHLDDRLVEF